MVHRAKRSWPTRLELAQAMPSRFLVYPLNRSGTATAIVSYSKNLESSTVSIDHMIVSTTSCDSCLFFKKRTKAKKPKGARQGHLSLA